MRARSLHRAWALLLAPALLGCARSPRPPDVLAQAEALEAEGKLEEAAQRLGLACALTTDRERCAAAEARAADVRIRAADEALGEERFAAAEQALLRALATADAGKRAQIEARLGREDLVAGLRYERALAGKNPETIARVLAEIAATAAPIAGKARRWLAEERPPRLIRAVDLACGPEHRGSCSLARAELMAAGIEGPEAAEALALADAEARRVAALCQRAEAHLRFFANEGQKQRVLERCLNNRASETPDWGQLHDTCEEEAFGADPPEEAYRQRRNNEALFRRLLQSIADPEIRRDLEALRRQALREGKAAKLDLPRAAPAPKSP